MTKPMLRFIRPPIFCGDYISSASVESLQLGQLAQICQCPICAYTVREMSTHRLVKSVVIAAPIEAVFAFHLKPENLRLISPPSVKVVKLRLPERIEEGSVIELHTRLHGCLPSCWEVEIMELKSPYRLVDVARRSPFKFWRHTHEFRSVANGTEMTDIVEYQLPLGWLGRVLAEPWLVRPQLEAMFRYRHERTRVLLEARSAIG